MLMESPGPVGSQSFVIRRTWQLADVGVLMNAVPVSFGLARCRRYTREKYVRKTGIRERPRSVTLAFNSCGVGAPERSSLSSTSFSTPRHSGAYCMSPPVCLTSFDPEEQVPVDARLAPVHARGGEALIG